MASKVELERKHHSQFNNFVVTEGYIKGYVRVNEINALTHSDFVELCSSTNYARCEDLTIVEDCKNLTSIEYLNS